MSHAARSLLLFGYYLLALGVSVLLVPNTLLGLFAVPPTRDVWIRVVGLLTINIGWYFIYAARHAAAPFFRLTVYTRAFVLVGFAGFVSLDWAPAALLLFGAVDGAGAVWTALALRRDAETQTA